MSQIHYLLCFTMLITIIDTLCNRNWTFRKNTLSKEKGGLCNNWLECVWICISVHSQCHRFTLCLVLPCLSLSLTLCATGIEHLETIHYQKKKGDFPKEVFRTCNVLPFSCTHLALWRGKEEGLKLWLTIWEERKLDFTKGVSLFQLKSM